MNNIFQNDWKHWIGLATALLLIYAQGSYLYSLYKAGRPKLENKHSLPTEENKELKPVFLSWIGWSILMGISFISQYYSGGWTIKLIGLLVSTLGCLIIGLAARFIFKRYSYKKEDNKFILYGLICSTAYILTNNAWITTIAAIIADLILAIPTIKNAWSEPKQEKSIAWPLAFGTWILNSIVVIIDFSWLHLLWPIYLILFNGTMSFLTHIRPLLKNTNR